MSPSEDEAAGHEGRQQPRADAGCKRANVQGENLEVNENQGNTQDRVLDLLVGLNKQMDRKMASQEEKERANGLKTSVFSLVLQKGEPMSREALHVTPPRLVSPAITRRKYYIL